MFQTQPKKQQPASQNDSVIESIRDLGSGVTKTMATDVLGGIATDALTSLFGTPRKTWGPSSEPAPAKTEAPLPMRREAARPVMRRPDIDLRPMIEADGVKIKQQIESVRMELKKLSVSIQSLNTEIQKAVNDIPVQPGVYHLNFLERLKGILQILREQIEDSSSWLALSTNRKKKKGYWGMYKKHGTKFGLSSERNLATQAG